MFHDLGNINYTFIEEGGDDKFGNYAVFSKPVIEVLRDLGVPAELKGRNDLVIDGKKFSGNAQTLWHGRMMHHGTLMSVSYTHLDVYKRQVDGSPASRFLVDLRNALENFSLLLSK